MKTKVAYLVKPRCFEIREEDAKPEKGQVLIKLSVCALCNYELNHWQGKMGEYPMRIGHESAGVVVEIGEGVTRIKVDDKVTGAIWSAFAEYVTANEKDMNILNDDINPLYGFSEPLKCITTVLRLTQPQAGDYGIVLGCGPMGLWCVQGLKGNLLAGLIAIDVKDENLELAKKYGATYTINSSREDVEKKIVEITNGHMADFLIEGTGIPNVVNQSMNYLCTRGRFIIMSSYKAAADCFDLSVGVKKALNIIFAHGSETAYDDWRRAALLINNKTFDNEGLITHRFSLDEINEAFHILENKPNDFVKGIIQFE